MPPPARNVWLAPPCAPLLNDADIKRCGRTVGGGGGGACCRGFGRGGGCCRGDGGTAPSVDPGGVGAIYSGGVGATCRGDCSVAASDSSDIGTEIVIPPPADAGALGVRGEGVRGLCGCGVGAPSIGCCAATAAFLTALAVGNVALAANFLPAGYRAFLLASSANSRGPLSSPARLSLMPSPRPVRVVIPPAASRVALALPSAQDHHPRRKAESVEAARSEACRACLRERLLERGETSTNSLSVDRPAE
eukprot:scaffold90061_cov66-Phaeocystis_antarctica.AAC.13